MCFGWNAVKRIHFCQFHLRFFMEDSRRSWAICKIFCKTENSSKKRLERYVKNTFSRRERERQIFQYLPKSAYDWTQNKVIKWGILCNSVASYNIKVVGNDLFCQFHWKIWLALGRRFCWCCRKSPLCSRSRCKRKGRLAQLGKGERGANGVDHGR